MTALVALLFALPCQDTADDLKKEIEKLRAQNRDLQDRVNQLDEASVQDALEIKRLRAAIKSLETANQPPVIKPATGLTRVNGPLPVLKGRIIHVESKQADPKFNFLLVDLGRDRRLEPGYRFEVVRPIHEKDKPDRLEKIGVAEFEKYIGPAEESSKLKIVEGSASDMRVEDEVVAIRKLEELQPRPEAEAAPAAAAPKGGVYKIILVGGRGKELTYTTTFGKTEGAKQSDVVFVYRDGAYKGNLRIDTVTADYSVASFITTVKDEADRPQVGDQVLRRRIDKSIHGKVALVDDKRGVATDLRERDGVKPGQKLEVRRVGQKIGTLVVSDVQAWGSWAKPDGDTKLDAIQKGDFVEAVEEKQ